MTALFHASPVSKKMDDFYFNDDSNKTRRRRPNGEIYNQSDFGGNNVYSDTTSRGKSPDGFRVNIPADEPDSGYYRQTRSRAPQGRPMYESNPQGRPSGNSRVPHGRPVYERDNNNGYPSSGNTGRTYGSYSPSAGNNNANGRVPVNPTSNRTAPYSGRPATRPASQGVRQTSGSGRPAPGGSSNGSSRPPKKSKGGKVAAAIFAVVIILIAAVFAYGYSILGKINYDTDSIKKNPYISEKQLYSNSHLENILLIGSDARSEIQGMRSDTMILFSIDKKNKQIKLTSFLRDSYVCIPSTGHWRKLNAACSAGGAQLVIDTIEYNFKVKIDSYVLVDFEVFTKLIDLMGGLTVKDVTAAEAKYLREKVKITYAKEGTNKFSGAAALWYCRIRYLDDDFHRTQRQRKVISAIIDQAKTMNPVELIKIVEQVLPMITTDIGRNDMLSLGLNAITKYARYDIYQHQIPAKGTWSNKRVSGVGDVLSMDIDKNVQLLRQFLSEKQTEETTTAK